MKLVTAIIQARMGSERLPGKVLYPLGYENKPALIHLIERIRRAKTIDDIKIVTTQNKEDMIIFEYGRKAGCDVWCGEHSHVLDNILDMCVAWNIENIVDVTADCPLIDPRHIDRIVKIFKKKPDNVSYASNIINRTYPRGFDVQVYGSWTLKLFADMITDERHKNHSGWNIMIRENIHNVISFSRKPKEDLSHWRLCIDEYDDYSLIQILFYHFPNNKFSCNDVIRFLKRNPRLLEINSHIKQKVPGRG